MSQTGVMQRAGGPVAGFKQPLFFGWYVLAATFFIDLVVTGTRNSIGIFVLPRSMNSAGADSPFLWLLPWAQSLVG